MKEKIIDGIVYAFSALAFDSLFVWILYEWWMA